MESYDVDDDVEALSEFVAGSSIAEIAKIYRWSIRTTEEHIRRAFCKYGFRRPPASHLQSVRYAQTVRRISRDERG